MPHQKLVARLTAVAGLSAQDAAALNTMPHIIQSLEHGEHLLRSGDRPSASSIVISGVIARQKIVGERNQISSFYLVGDMPDLQTLQIPTVDFDLCSIGEAVIASVPHSHLRGLMQSAVSLTEALWRDSLLQGARYSEWVNNIGSRPALERIAHLLCELARRLEIVGLARSGSDGTVIDIPLRQQNIADAVGLSIVHVNRSIQELRRRGMIEWQSHRLELVQRERLELICDFNADYLYARHAAPSGHNVIDISRQSA